MEQGKEKFLGKQLDTLVQSGTQYSAEKTLIPERTVFGIGSDMGDKAAMQRKAKRKTIAQTTALRLIEVVEKKGEPERKKAYWNTYHCQNKLYSADGRTFGKYCKNRVCPICNSTRKAEIINRYLPEISTWEDPYFVTLTVKAVPAQKLGLWLYGFQKAFRQIRDKFKKRHQRYGGLKLMGVKSLECNFNPIVKTYNPHLHLVVPNYEVAKTLMIEWQKKWTKDYTRPWAQHKRKVKNLEKDLIETIKYGTKVFTDPEMKNRSAKNKVPPVVYAAAIDTILEAMKPYRIFERFGFNLPKGATKSNPEPRLLQQCFEWEFDLSLHDWQNSKTGEVMTGYAPSAQLRVLLSDHVDTDLQ